MQAVARARCAQAGLLQASRMLSTTSTALREGHEGGRSGRAGDKAERENAYKSWAGEVYRSDKLPGRGHGGNAQQQRQQQQQAAGGGSGGSGSGRPQHSRRREPHDRRGDWQQRDRQDGGIRANYASKGERMEASDYVRVAPKQEQRQQRMFPAYLYNTSRSLLRQDVAAFFDGYNLSEDEIRPQFSWRNFEVERFWLNFPTALDRERALSRHMAYLGTRRVLVKTATPSDFTAGIYNPLAMSSRGRYVLVENIALHSTSEDLIRYFHGFDLHPKSVSFLKDSESERDWRLQVQQGARAEKAVVRFATSMEAHRAVRERHGGFCGNSQLRLRLLL